MIEAAVHYLLRGPQQQPDVIPARSPLAERAARLWPESPRNKDEWLRAVALVRRTRRGWLLERPTPKGQPQ